MTQIADRLTLEQFLALPERKPALEFEDGEVSQKVSPTGPHSALQSLLTDHINHEARPRKIAWAFPELRTTFAGRSRVPDVAVYRWDRIPRDARGRIVHDFLEPPDIVFEIISPGQSVNRLIRRCISFVNGGVKAAVLVDPHDESIVIIRSGVEPTTLRAGDTLDLTNVIPGLRLDVAALFQALRD
jgi:Uma2 family endonuclease